MSDRNFLDSLLFPETGRNSLNKLDGLLGSFSVGEYLRKSNLNSRTNLEDKKSNSGANFDNSSARISATNNLAIAPQINNSLAIVLPPPIGSVQANPLAASWTPAGPSPILNGQVENIRGSNPVIGAIHTVLAHPTNANILYIGATNGGIWRSTNATALNLTWEYLSSDLPSNSIGAMAFDSTDPTSLTIIVGIGRFSSYGRLGGPLTGLLLTTDGGNSFTQINDPLLVGRNFTGVVKQGNLILATANNFGGGINGGLYRSTDNGVSWTFVSGTNGLPQGAIFDLVSDPTNNNRFYVSVQGLGIFRTDDLGLNWTNITSGDPTGIGQAFATAIENNNAEMAVANNGRLYVAVIDRGQPSYIGYKNSFETNWTAMDLPKTLESNGEIEGLSPRVKPGGQGSIHFSIVVDPNDPNIVYVAGDRQDLPFPNFIGANDYTGRIFRGDTRVLATGEVPSPQWEHLTHRNDIAAIPGGGTANSSAPHADSREMTFDANGNLIEVDDGGIYRRTSPQDNTGDWFSLNSNLQITEIHNIAYDAVANIIISANQDTGTTQQLIKDGTVWTSLPLLQFDFFSTGDGGDLAVDNVSLASRNQSIRYSSFQNLGLFRRQVYDAGNNLISETIIDPQPIVGSQPLEANFTTPIELNVIDPSRLLIGGENFVYESYDRGDTIAQIGSGIQSRLQNAMAYGGRLNGVDNPDIVYYGSGTQVYVRTNPLIDNFPTSSPFPGGIVRDLVLDPDNWQSAFVIDSDRVFLTVDAGATNWFDITGDLADLSASDQSLNLRTIECISSSDFPDLEAIVVGTGSGIFAALSSDFTDWFELGNLPNVPVWDMDYNATDKILVAGTLGRGAFTLKDPAAILLNFDIIGTAGNDLLTAVGIDDAINAGAGDDTMNGGTGNNYFNGATGNDSLGGNAGNDTLFGASGDDFMEGGIGNDYLDGGAGRDTLDGGLGDDGYFGGRGIDLFVLRSGDGIDTIFDYQDGTDLFFLGQTGLSFNDLAITQDLNRSVISIALTNEVLAYVENVAATSIDLADFA